MHTLSTYLVNYKHCLFLNRIFRKLPLFMYLPTLISDNVIILINKKGNINSFLQFKIMKLTLNKILHLRLKAWSDLAWVETLELIGQ